MKRDKELDAALAKLSAIHEAQNNLLGFAKYTGASNGKEFIANWHHELICRKLDQFVNGNIKRLMIFTRPQVGKSELTSRKLPAYILGKNPNARIIATSYSPTLAESMNRDVQKLIDGDEYKDIFPNTQLSGKNIVTVAYGNYKRNSQEFEIVDNYGSYRCAGTGQGITGMSADYIIIDDPLKSREEANSAVYREKSWSWYTDSLDTRKHNDTGIVLTCTRWHEDDLPARLLKQAKNDPEADQWEVIILPAEMDDIENKHPEDPRKTGEALWEAMHSSESQISTRRTVGAYTWEAMYQQRPTPKGGGHYFKRTQISTTPGEGFLEFIPADVEKWVRGWDLAATPEDERGDAAYTASVLIGKRKNGRFIVADVTNQQLSANDVEKTMYHTSAQDKAKYGYGVTVKYPQDPGQAGKAQAQRLASLLSGFNVKYETESGDKATRATPFAAQWQAGNVDILLAPWNEEYITQLEQFPSGKFKDMADASGTSFNELAENQEDSLMSWL